MKTKQGISLIVLVITIIVMIILAGAIILSLNNSGIIDKASDAVEDTDLATVKELAQMAWAEAYLETDKSQKKLDEYVLNELQEELGEGITEKYVIEVTTKGVDVVLKGPWVQTRDTVTNGNITIKVGEKINYIATGTDYKEDWKVLGASEYGELLIMSDSDVTEHSLGYKSTTTDGVERLKEAQNSWLNGAAELDAICEVYGKGTGATGARSVTIEDIDRVTGFDKTTYGEGKIYKYLNEVTYLYNGTTKPSYTATNDTEGGKLSYAHTNGFHYYDGTNFVKADLSKATGIITTLKSDYYYYDLAWSVELTDEASDLIFGEYDEGWETRLAFYWLASPFVCTDNDCAFFGMRRVGNWGVWNYYLWASDGNGYCHEQGVRAVVSLATDVNITANPTGGWNIN